MEEARVEAGKQQPHRRQDDGCFVGTGLRIWQTEREAPEPKGSTEEQDRNEDNRIAPPDRIGS
jgi:hypothetical protein